MISSLTEQGLLALVKKDLACFLKQQLALTETEILSLLEQPRRPEYGHLSLPLFSVSKTKEASPQEEARRLAERVCQNLPPILKQCKALSAFVNFQFQESYLQNQLETLSSQKKLVCFQNDRPEHWLMDFASPNVAKYMNIGHLRATVLGQALVNLARSFGVKVTALNHLGDWGSQFGKLLWAYQKWGHEYDFKKEPFSSLVQLYVRFHKSAESDEKNLQEARNLFQKLEEGDLELKKLWSFFVELSLKNYEQYWRTLNTKHDLIQGESFYVGFMEDLKNRLRAKNLLKKSEGAEVVFLEEDLPPCLIFKSDGASTYSARDLCSLIYRFEKLKAEKNIYITGSDQNLHFEQVLKTAGKLNPLWAQNSRHLSFGMYRFKGEGKMSTRQGQAVFLKDVLDQAIRRVEKIIQERNPGLENKKKIAQQVGIGAVIFNDLMNDRTKDVDFEWSKVLDFEGRSGPFVQYSLVRAQSLLNKYKGNLPEGFSGILEDVFAQRLVWRLIRFEGACFQSLKNFKPHILARYLLDLSREFNRFYAGQKILGHRQEGDLILLTELIRRVLDRGLEILNVPRPQAM